MNNKLLKALLLPFAPSELLWKPGQVSKEGNRCLALAYADLRSYYDRLDQACGTEWSCRYIPWVGNRIICELTIVLHGPEAIGGTTRSSTGEADAQDEKNGMAASVAEAMAFKRACAAFGLGRALYDLPAVWVEYDPQRRRISDAGQAELDSRYKTWYARKMATLAKGQPVEAEAPDDAPAPHLNGKVAA